MCSRLDGVVVSARTPSDRTLRRRKKAALQAAEVIELAALVAHDPKRCKAGAINCERCQDVIWNAWPGAEQ